MKTRLDHLDLDKQIEEKSEYREKLRGLQLKLLHAQRLLQDSAKSLILVFEGPDAAGKGGVIKRLTERLDPRLVRVWSVVKPTEEEKAHHYLWRFWGKLPVMGHTAIFDRSWYGRVLVERVEGFAKKEEWKRGYREILDFEKTLVDGGAILMKFLCTSQSRSSCAVLRGERRIRTSIGRSVRRIGGIAENGMSIFWQRRRCS